MERLHGPVGLRLEASTPVEIVIAILAEMTSVRRGMHNAGAFQDWSGSTTACRTA